MTHLGKFGRWRREMPEELIVRSPAHTTGHTDEGIQAPQPGSNQIKPNQTKPAAVEVAVEIMLKRPDGIQLGQPSQSQSNQEKMSDRSFGPIRSQCDTLCRVLCHYVPSK